MPNTRKRGRKENKGSAFKPRPAGSAPPQSLTTEDLWREIETLRAQMNEIRASSLAPKFAHIDLDSAANGSRYYDLGFEPGLIWMYGQFASSLTVLTMSVGFCTSSHDFDGHLFQSVTTIRRSAGGQFRASGENFVVAMLADDNASLDQRLAIDSLDPGGFSYTVTAGPLDLVRGFAIGR